MVSNKAPKRSKMQIGADRVRTTELMLQGYSYQQIADIIEVETGTKLTKRTIGNDVAAIRKDWELQRSDNYELLINKELSRIDLAEKEAWRAWKASCSPVEQKTIEEIAKEVDGDIELVVSKVVTHIKDTGEGVGDPRFLNMVLETQKERRRVLGLYAPGKLGVDINKKSMIVVKGYGTVSPDDWPAADIVEGEIIEEVRKELSG